MNNSIDLATWYKRLTAIPPLEINLTFPVMPPRENRIVAAEYNEGGANG